MTRDAPRPAAAARTCCNKCRPASVCSTFGRAECILVPLPAAMITTFNTMPLPASGRGHSRPTIIAALLLSLTLALCACGMVVKLAYNQGSSIAFRWLDAYVDFDDAQSMRVRAALDEWFAWHRRTQLPDYADRFARAGVEVLADTTANRVCGWNAEIHGRIGAGIEHAVPALAD